MLNETFSVTFKHRAKIRNFFSLRRSSRQRKKPKHQEEEQKSTKKRPKEDKEKTIKPLVSNHQSRLIPTINSLVSTDTRNLQLVTPIFQDSLSVSEYLKHCLEASIVTSNAIDEASASGLDLDQVSLDNTELLNSLFKSGNTAFSFDENSKTENLRDHIIEDSIERAIRSADETTAELIRAAQTATTADHEDNAGLVMMQPALANDSKRKSVIEFDSNALITAAQNSALVTKTPKKIGIKKLIFTLDGVLILNFLGTYEESNSNTTFSSLFKTPKKTPIKSLKDHMSEDSIDKALSGLFKTPVKGLEQVANAAAESLMRRTPAKKIINQKSPMPSPFLGSPKTPIIPDIQSISFNQDEIHVTPSVQAQEDKCLSLEISPSLSLNTPSPVASTEASPSDGPLITPPLDMHAPITPAKYTLNGSLGAPRTPCRTPLSRAVDELVMNSPLKALSDAAKRLFNEEGQNKTFVFLSPSKRVPKRASLVQVDSR